MLVYNCHEKAQCPNRMQASRCACFEHSGVSVLWSALVPRIHASLVMSGPFFSDVMHLLCLLCEVRSESVSRQSQPDAGNLLQTLNFRLAYITHKCSISRSVVFERPEQYQHVQTLQSVEPVIIHQRTGLELPVRNALCWSIHSGIYTVSDFIVR